MPVVQSNFEIDTKPFCDIIDITRFVQDVIQKTQIKDGIVNVHVAGSTGAISTVEYEPGLVQGDIKDFLDKLVPYDKDYNHHRTWNDRNGAGHLRSFFLKTSQTFPFQNQTLILGSWQQIVFIECDENARNRKIYVTIIGE